MEITICDVGPRDGLQNEERTLAPAVRADLVDRLAACGVPRIEVASFVRDDLVPQMAGGEDVVAAVHPRPGIAYSGLVLNERGYERLRATTLTTVTVNVSASETFQQRNGNSSVADAVGRARAVVERAIEDGRRASFSISTAFGCPYEGEVDPGIVYDLAAQAVGMGVDEVVLADTIGVSTPGRVDALVCRCHHTLRVPIGVHLHDTRGTAVAGVWAALTAGATVVDASVGGAGGCPFAPGAQGNAATEDVVYMLEREGIATGVDLDGLVGVAHLLGELLGRALPGRVSRAAPWPI